MRSLLEARQPVWRSADGLMETGSAKLAEQMLYYSSLGNRLVTLEEIQAFAEGLRHMPQPWPLVLMSCCPGFDATPEAEAQGLVLAAGQLRALQQQRKQAGGRIVSIADEVSVGGLYLMHGLSAQQRAATPGTVFYDTVPGRPSVPLEQVLVRGLIDAIIPAELLPAWLAKACFDASL